MQREILFRGKRVDNGAWEEGDLSRHKNGKEYIRRWNIGGYAAYEVIPETVGQYIGFTDVKGKKIFEGDIIGYSDIYSTENGYGESDCVGKVGWSDEEACFYVTGRLSAESWEVFGECEIIGNVFDDPGLMGM